MQKATKGRRILTARTIGTVRDKTPAPPLAVVSPEKPAETAKPENPTEASRPLEPPKSAGSARKVPPQHHTMLKEFTFPDAPSAPGVRRPIMIHRHSVHWCTPAKDRPETVTLVGIKSGEKPVPLQIRYDDFVLWWRGAHSPAKG